ncbi:TonB-dependent siderophore receptor [Paraburkholderia sp.]|uniref:TonB-dependent siderophore receptor n=1 Tax=Paraburkholderia sp. TaxID=1926495 RepID=UPI0023916AC5|nr:TonB-dependent siderophore receptor [Paraburkholderia sp.]MDE1179058.1 TonB-dependent siderophore receptor [Paraburkholderia sp.]
MNTGVRGSTALSLLLCLLGGTSAVYAQTSTTQSAATADGAQLPTVKVNAADADSHTGVADGYVPVTATTATKTDTPLIETPQSVSVVTQAQMTAQAATSVAAALRYTSSVLPELRGASTDGAPYLYSRGFVLEQFMDGTRMPSDTSFGYAVPNFDPYGLERIDVLHGPSSVLYGQANPGGVANLVSKRPTTTPIHEVFVTTGSHNRAEFGFDLGGALTADGKLSYRLTGLGLDTGTQVDGVKQKRIYIAPAVTWKPDDNTTLTVMAKYQRDPDVGYYNYVPAIGSILDNPNGQISSHTNVGDENYDHHTRTQYSVGYEFEHRFNPVWTVRQNLRYTVVSDDLANVFPYPNGYATGSTTTINRYAFTNDETAKFFTVDNQAQAKFTTGPLAHTALFGFDFQRVWFKQTVGSNFVEPTLNLFNPVYLPITGTTATSNDMVRMKQFGAYAQDQIAYGKWRFLMGVREDWAAADDTNPLQGYALTQSQRAFTWRTGLVYLFDNGLAPYASYSKSFDPQIGSTYTGAPLKPTTAEQYEIGIKYQPRGYNSFITASLFDLRERNVASSDADHSGYSVQIGQVRARGLELEGHASLSDNLDLVASYTYLNNVTTQSNLTGTTIDGATVSLQGLQPWGIPRHSASAWLDYTLHAGTFRGLGFGGGVRYVGASYDQTNTIHVGSRTLIDAAVHYDTGKHWLFSVNGTNLFNRQYVAACQSGGICNFGDGVEVLASARYRW